VLCMLILMHSDSHERCDMNLHRQAEAFAALVNGGLIGIEGAVKTIVALLRKLDNRSAAVTMMGKTAELCVEQVRAGLERH